VPSAGKKALKTNEGGRRLVMENVGGGVSPCGPSKTKLERKRALRECVCVCLE